MMRILLAPGTLVVGLATLMWAPAPIDAQHGGHGGGGHSAAGHSAAHIGSVHYGARVAPGPIGRSVQVGAVRGEHYAGTISRGGYRNPYRDEYFRHFRPGYRPYMFGDAQYYGYGSLPVGYQTVVLNGITYYLYDGVYYQAYLEEGQTVYLVVPDQ